MSDVMRALSISGAVLIGVVGFIVVISFVAVRRGEAEMAQKGKPAGPSGHH